MKNLILLVVFLITATCAAQNKKFDKIIKKYDVIECVKDLDNSRPELFWDAVYRNNETFNKLCDAVKKKKTSAVAAQKDLRDASLYSSIYYDNLQIDEELQEIADTLIKFVGIKEIYPDIKPYVVYSTEVNAYCCPDGRIYLTDRLLMRNSITFEGLVGICAHETTHFLLQHSLAEAYSYRKKENRNKLMAGIVSAVNVVANAYAQANGAANEESWDNVNKMIENNVMWVGDNALKYRYKYSREQEIEADIIAYRFLEWLGIGGVNYINALKSIGYDNDILYDDTSDHPTTKFRAELLEYLANKTKCK